jgi:hypothetical protein
MDTDGATPLLTSAELLAAEARQRIADLRADVDRVDGIEPPQAQPPDEIASRRARKAQTGPQGTF